MTDIKKNNGEPPLNPVGSELESKKDPNLGSELESKREPTLGSELESQREPSYNIDSPIEEEGSYISKKTSYYLDFTEILQKTEDIDDTKPLYPCIFKVNNNGYAPYLLYLLEYDSTTKTYKWARGSQEVPNGSSIFQKLLLQYPFLFNDTDERIGTIDDVRLKGFYTENPDHILAVYDTTTFKTDLLEENPDYIWATTYEILSSRNIYGIPIDESVISVFLDIYKTHKYDFHHLKREGTEDDYVRAPYTLYLCQKENSTYSNVSKLEEDNIRILYPRVDHEKLDRFFLFSSDLIYPGSLEENLKIQRFAVFVDIDPTIHILFIDGTDAENNADLDHLYDGTLEPEPQIVTFIEDDKQFWSIRNPALFSQIE